MYRTHIRSDGRSAAVLFSAFLFFGFSVAIRPCRAVEVAGLYEAETIVTGQGETERQRGFGIGLAEVIVKLSGDADSVRFAGVQRILSRVGEFVERYEYEDRMKGIPIHDEQGTRDRPYYLRMSFKRQALNERLTRLGLPRWGSDRPRVIVWLGIEDSVRSYVLDPKTEFGLGQRETLKSVARERGVPLVIPNADSHTVSYADVARGDLTKLREASKPYAADAILFGTLVMDENGYWMARWSLAWKNRVAPNALDKVTFDVALRAAVERAARRFATAERGG